MPPLERHDGRLGVHLEHLPRERRHHALERLVARAEVHGARVVVFTGRQDGAVRADAQHVRRRHGRALVHRERVPRRVHRAPVRQPRLERGLDLPVLDEVLDEVGEAVRGVVAAFGFAGVGLAVELCDARSQDRGG